MENYFVPIKKPSILLYGNLVYNLTGVFSVFGNRQII
jgi:hypothetical protein